MGQETLYNFPFSQKNSKARSFLALIKTGHIMGVIHADYLSSGKNALYSMTLLSLFTKESAMMSDSRLEIKSSNAKRSCKNRLIRIFWLLRLCQLVKFLVNFLR